MIEIEAVIVETGERSDPFEQVATEADIDRAGLFAIRKDGVVLGAANFSEELILIYVRLS